MITVPIVDATKTYVKPLGWDNNSDGHCGDLSVRVEKHGRHDYCLSWWEPTVEELQLLAQGGRVQLTCVGIQPPVSLTVIPNG